MSVLVVGLSHKSAPVSTLERAAVSGDTLGEAAARRRAAARHRRDVRDLDLQPGGGLRRGGPVPRRRRRGVRPAVALLGHPRRRAHLQPLRALRGPRGPASARGLERPRVDGGGRGPDTRPGADGAEGGRGPRDARPVAARPRAARAADREARPRRNRHRPARAQPGQRGYRAGRAAPGRRAGRSQETAAWIERSRATVRAPCPRGGGRRDERAGRGHRRPRGGGAGDGRQPDPGQGRAARGRRRRRGRRLRRPGPPRSRRRTW